LSGRIAQCGEHLPYKQGVTGSNPVAPTTFYRLIKMKKECNGCFCIRVLIGDTIRPVNPEQMTCEMEELDCPCKICLVKITCNMIDHGDSCQKWMDFNIKHATSDYWVVRRRKQLNT
jgi:hypothetical protein